MVRHKIDSEGTCKVKRPSELAYRSDETGTYYEKKYREQTTSVKLANFECRIEEQIVIDDGVESRSVMLISGRLNGQPLPKIKVSVEELRSWSFLGKLWPIQALIEPGQLCKERAYHSAVSLSGEIPTRQIFGHLGWIKKDGENIFLHAEGALGKDGPVEGIECSLSPELSPYCLQKTPIFGSFLQSVRASATFLKARPIHITGPLFSALFRSVLGNADLSIWLFGRTQSQKTSLAAVLLAHFGAGFTRNNMPANWSSTANALEAVAFAAKDVLLVIDDYVPRGTSMEMRRLEATAQRILRSAGNQSGRQRMKSDSSIRSAKQVRALIVSTAEAAPTGESETARALILELRRLEKSELHFNEVLDRLQEAAQKGELMNAMSAFIIWAAPRLNELQMQISAGIGHSKSGLRSAEQCASLTITMDIWKRFAMDMGMAENQAHTIAEEAKTGILEAARKQLSYQSIQDPVSIFLDVVRDGFASSAFHLLPRESESPLKDQLGNHGGAKVGWFDDEYAYFVPSAIHKEVALFLQKSGTTFPITKENLAKLMREAGVLVPQSGRDNTVTVRVGSGTIRAWRIPISLILLDAEISETDETKAA